MAKPLPRMVSPLFELGPCDKDHHIHIILALLLMISSVPQVDQNNQLARISNPVFLIISVVPN